MSTIKNRSGILLNPDGKSQGINLEKGKAFPYFSPAFLSWKSK